MALDRALFANPTAEYRPIPFWSWNDRLEPGHLRRQMQAFAQAGIGGVFMHARPGIWTPFLSDEWFAAVDTTIDAAQQHGMQAWIYDESSYPSGFAGGFVLERRPDLAYKVLVCQVVTAADGAASGPDYLGAFHLSGESYQRVSAASVPESSAGGVYLRFSLKKGSPSDWLNGFTYADLMHPDSARTFLEVAYEPYRERYSKHFGGLIPGAFTDEPHLGVEAVPGAGTLPWTPALPGRYQERYGEDLLERLPELFAEVGDYGVTRCRYWRLVTELFIESWMRPMYEWCDSHQLQFTGHLWEHVFAPIQSGSIMAPLAYMHIPGIDLLGRDIPLYRLPQDGSVPRQMGNVHMVKAVSSVAHQLGRKRVLSETYGGGGWDLSFEEQKQYAEWEFALGINLLNPHLSHYSLRGYRKHDYPISFQEHQPWWSEYRLLADYFGRLSYALSQGRYRAELLVLHPMASLWREWRPAVPGLPAQAESGGDERIKWIEVNLDHLLKALSAANWDYDLGDDFVLAEHARIDKTGPAPVLRVGEMAYRAVVIPASTNLAASTVRLLEDFLAAGGRVYALAPTPFCVDGAPADLSGLLSKCHIVPAPAVLLSRLAAAEQAGELKRLVRTTTSSTTAPLYHLVREVEEGFIVFLANVGMTPHQAETVYLPGPGPVERWDLATGSVETLAATPCEGGAVAVTLDFTSTGSYLLLCRKEGAATAAPTGSGAACCPVARHEMVLPSTWQFHRRQPNALVLDIGCYRIGDGPWQGPTFTNHIGQVLRRRVGEPVMQIRDRQPWRKHPGGAAPRHEEEISIRYTVQSELAEWQNLELVVEDGNEFSVAVNGGKVEPLADASSWWLDPAFRRFRIGAHWQAGKNEIELRFRFHADLPIEPAFLLGDFALAGVDARQFRLVAEPARLRSGTWVDQGYPFYAGQMVYTQQLELPAGWASGRLWLEFSNLPNVTRVRCNGRDAGAVAWQPYRLELTGLLQPGPNRLELVVANSLRNLLGPQHKAQLGLIVNPWDFAYSKSWQQEYVFTADGLTDTVRLVCES